MGGAGMKQITLKIEGKNYDLVTPSSWSEVTVKQFLLLETDYDGKDPVKLLSILSGLDYHLIENSNSSTINKIEPLVSFVNNNQPDFLKLKRSKTIEIDGKTIKMPTRLNKETFGQTIKMQELLEAEQSLTAAIPQMMAIYIQPRLDGSFNVERLEEVKELINDLYILDVYPHCFFFFKQYQRLLKIGILL
jgi:hypothetical protein